ncbi:MAG: PadR family transcriptional regulator [Clostridiaceae bacterium]|nr:PadR family transcriptional regulator [Eubacteriales bacterium]
MPTDKGLTGGSAGMLLLKLLEERDMYGYQMTETLRARSNDVFALKAGTLYPLLHTLETKGFVRSYASMADGRERRYYALTERGRTHLREREAEWESFSLAVTNVLKGGVLRGAS